MNELWQRGCELDKSLVMSLKHIHGQSYDFTQVIITTKITPLFILSLSKHGRNKYVMKSIPCDTTDDIQPMDI